jgi:transposase
MKSHRVIDLLADREAETAAAWMRAHPEIDLVSRDRGGDYASAATAGAPQAVQCADRFHVIKNLREALEGVLAHHLAQERKRQTQVTEQEAAPAWRAKRAPRSAPKLEHLQQARRQERIALYEQVTALRQQGLSQQAIAQRMNIGHSTVSRWLAEGRFPERKPTRPGQPA